MTDKAKAWYDKLKELRKDSGKTQKEVCTALGLNHTKSYIRWENGDNVPLPIFRMVIANIFGVTESELFGEDPKTKLPIVKS